MAAYTRRVTKKLWERLPMLVYALMRCELFGINWYHLLGLELLSVVRSAHKEFHTMFKMFQKKIAEMGEDGDPKALMAESSKELERILAPLGRAEEAVKGLTKELELFRKSEIGKAFSRASNLSHELVVHKKEASAAQQAADVKFKGANRAADEAAADLKAAIIRLQSANDTLMQEKEQLQTEVRDLQDGNSASELRARHAETETAALRAELDAFHEMYQGTAPSTHHGRGSSASPRDEEWLSRPADYETRQRTAALCQKALERRGHRMQMLNVSFDCTDLAMVTADNNLVFLGGPPGGYEDDAANMKVHVINLESGVVMEDVECSGRAPEARKGHHAFFFRDPQAGPVIYVCGGVSWAGNMCFNDMFCLNLTSRIWSEVVTALPMGGPMSGSHNGPSMYLFGTSWEDGQPALCVLHSMQHAGQSMSSELVNQAITPEDSRQSVGSAGSHREQPPRPQSSASELSDWSRSVLPGGTGPHQRVTDSPEPPREEHSESDGTFLTRPPDDDADASGSHRTQTRDATGNSETAIVAVGGDRTQQKPSVRGMIETEHSFGEGASLPRRGASHRVKHSRPGQPMLLSGHRPLSGSSAITNPRNLPDDGRPASQPGRSRALYLSQHQHMQASPIPGGTWVPPDHYRNWFQGNKAIARMPTARPPSGPSRPDKRDFAGARFFGPNPYRMQWETVSLPRSANPIQANPTAALGPDWQQGARNTFMSTEDSVRSGSTTKSTIGYEASDLVEHGHWDSWMGLQTSSKHGAKTRRGVTSAGVSSSSALLPTGSRTGTGPRAARTLSAQERRIMKRPPNHPVQHTQAADLL